jgi:hypothetical protein
LALCFTLGAGFAGAGSAFAQTAQPDFGSAPSGEIPILYNDQHVYAKPDRERANRVLAALVKNGTILVPLRSMFEQMGATVSYDPASRSVTVSKPGAEVKVTLGKPLVTINGEDRPLDVPPEMYKGVLVVPLRVISEGMGAYVQWLAEKRLVVVRYLAAPSPTPIPATPPPPPPATAAPTAAPTAPPTPTPPKPRHNEAFVAGDYDFSPIVYNEISPGNRASDAYNVKGAIEFPLAGTTFMLAGDYDTLRYPHNSDLGPSVCAAGTAGCNTVSGHDAIYQPGFCPSPDPGCVTVVGFQNIQAFNGLGQAYVPAFTATESDFDARLGIKVADPRFYIGVAGFYKHYNYLGYPNLGGIGFGAEKLPDLDQPLSLYGSVYYYPSVSGNYTYPSSVFLGTLSSQVIKLSYSELKFQVGGTIDLGSSPLYIDVGYGGLRANAKINAPSNTLITSPYAGLGLHF